MERESERDDEKGKGREKEGGWLLIGAAAAAAAAAAVAQVSITAAEPPAVVQPPVPVAFCAYTGRWDESPRGGGDRKTGRGREREGGGYGEV